MRLARFARVGLPARPLSRRRWTVRLALGAAGFLVAAWAGPAAAAPGSAGVYVARAEPPASELARFFNSSVERLRKCLSDSHGPRPEPTAFRLVSPVLDPAGDDLLTLQAEFLLPGDSRVKDENKRTIWSDKARNRRYQVETALDKLLLETLFDPKQGLYGTIRIDKCSPQSDAPVLTLRWDKGPGLESGLLYELGQEGVGGTTWRGIYYHLQRQANLREAKVRHVRPTQEKDALDCTFLGKPGNVLRRRYPIYETAEGSDHGNKAIQ